jgi:hypothetical protein
MSTPSNEPAATPAARTYAEPRGEWAGHALRTRYVLEPLQLRCAVQEDPKISQSERVLLNACEFCTAPASRAS